MTMMNLDEENVEVVPLTNQLSSYSSQYSTPPTKSGSSRLSRSLSTDGTPLSSERESLRLAKQAAASLCFAMAGWYYPRYLVSQEDSIANQTVPYQTTAAGDVILDFLLNQPLVEPQTVPDTLLIWTSIHLPLAWMAWMAWTLAAGSSRRRNGIHDMHAAVCGLLTSIGLSEGATILLKFYVQRRRPNFYALCGWSSELLKCTASTQKIREASFSFPSGHSSLSSCAMVYLAWFCLSKVVAARGPRWLALVSCVLPVSWAFLVGASRLADHWHHPSDVIAGLVLGSVCATVAFHTWYPPVWSAPQLVGLPWSLHNTDIAKLPSFLE